MTEFIQTASAGGMMLLPADVVDPSPLSERWREDARCASRTGEQIAAVGDRSVPTEAALELRTSRQHAAGRLDRARALVGRMPRLLAAMQAGDLEGYPAGRIVEA
ncbi:MAG: hypothetical protein ACRDSE_14660, partial [Pseudonocardiaceae bacterium]